jgi:copper homeostasis protein CutC
MEYKLEIYVDNIESAIDAQNAGATEFHLTGRKIIESEMTFQRQSISKGNASDIPEFSRKVIDPDMIRSIINKLKLI